MAKKFDFKKIAMKATGAAGGGVVAVVSNKVLGKFDPKIRGFAKIAAGAILPELAPKSAFVNDMGCGLIGAAAAELTEALAPGLAEPVSGLGIGNDRGYITDENYDLSGTDPERVISALPDEAVVGDIPDNDEEF